MLMGYSEKYETAEMASAEALLPVLKDSSGAPILKIPKMTISNDAYSLCQMIDEFGGLLKELSKSKR